MEAGHPVATPARMPVAGRIGWLRGAIGAGLAIWLAGLAGHLALAGQPALPWLLAPMGASAVLVFVLPASPLAQPWPVIGSHVIAALAGIIARSIAAEPWLIAGIAVGVAIAATSVARCLHPPAGGTALVTALASPAVAGPDAVLLLWPMAINLVVLVACGLAWNRATGHSWPHRAAPVPAPADWVGHIADEDLDAVLEEWDEVLDVSRDDLVALVHAVEARVRARLAG